MYVELFRAITDEREREIKDLIRVRRLLDDTRRERPFVQPRRAPQARTR
jgi:hypothetical protein